MGGERVEIDFTPFRAVSELLYGGPIVAERLVGIRAFVAEHGDAMHPVTRQIMEGGARHLGVDVFEALHHLHELRAKTLATWEAADFLFVPTTGTTYTIAEVEADPIRLNASLGVYTNFVNLLDLCAIAVPDGFRFGPPTGRDHPHRSVLQRDAAHRNRWRAPPARRGSHGRDRAAVAGPGLTRGRAVVRGGPWPANTGGPCSGRNARASRGRMAKEWQGTGRWRGQRPCGWRRHRGRDSRARQGDGRLPWTAAASLHRLAPPDADGRSEPPEPR